MLYFFNDLVAALTGMIRIVLQQMVCNLDTLRVELFIVISLGTKKERYGAIP